MGYLQAKNWARAYTPGAILGVYTPDELEHSAPRNVTPISNEPVYLTDAEFEANTEKWQGTFIGGYKNGKTVSDFVVWAEQKGKILTDDQKAVIESWTPIESEATETTDETSPESK